MYNIYIYILYIRDILHICMHIYYIFLYIHAACSASQDAIVPGNSKCFRKEHHLFTLTRTQQKSLRNAPFCQRWPNGPGRAKEGGLRRMAPEGPADGRWGLRSSPQWAEDEWAWWAGATLMVMDYHGISPTTNHWDFRGDFPWGYFLGESWDNDSNKWRFPKSLMLIIKVLQISLKVIRLFKDCNSHGDLEIRHFKNTSVTWAASMTA